MVLTDDKCVALIVYCPLDDPEAGEEENNKQREMPEPTFLLRQLPSLYRTETRYALIVYDKSFLKLNASGNFEANKETTDVREECATVQRGKADAVVNEDPEDTSSTVTDDSKTVSNDVRVLPVSEQCKDVVLVPVSPAVCPIRGGRQLDPEWQIGSLPGLPMEVLEGLFELLDAEALIHASQAGRRFVSFSRDNRLWKNLCQSKWQVHLNELHMPKNFHNEPREMYKFMTAVWRRVQKQCRRQQRVAALATVLRLPQETVQGVLLLCNS